MAGQGPVIRRGDASAGNFGVGSIDGFFDLSTWIAAIIGSVDLLAVYRLVTGTSATTATPERLGPTQTHTDSAFS
ncbi:GlsB/YeaQ/YmgE family stress response membrane protein [Streptomyces sp. NPDC085929]|uniref:GlsB/YeaQ/YmgE family stress response membrane protein n=1 Tax=Streptomyces sp. NPDC085929 TaxID=3365739 RepID=UPI0037D872ED